MRAQIGLLRGTGIVSRTIMFATNSPVSHVVLGVGDGLVMSPQLGGALLRAESSFFTPIVWSRYELTPGQADMIVDFALARQGAPYNMLEASAVLLSRFMTLKYPARQYAYYHCAQLANDAYLSAGVNPLPYRKEPGPVHPGHFHLQWAMNGWYDIPRRAVT